MEYRYIRKFLVILFFLTSASFLCAGSDANAKVAQATENTVATPTANISVPSASSTDIIPGEVVGFSFFKTDNAASSNLITNKTIRPDYVLKIDDEVVIDVWGELDLHYNLVINNEGYIVLPKVGRIDLNGLSFVEGKKKILNQLASKYNFYIDAINPGAGKAHVDVTLGKVGGVAIYMTGEVANPGMVYLNGSNCSVVSALKAGGGITPLGSLRNIEVTSTSGTKFKFDLYKFLFNGKLTTDEKYLKDGDTINVPFRESTAIVNGAVLRPGMYELTKNEKLRDFIDLAGGLSSSATGEIDVLRITIDSESKAAGIKKKEIFKINLKNPDEDLLLFDGDEIIAFRNSVSKLSDTIIIAGNGINMPSEQKYLKGLKITDYIKIAGGIYPDAADTVELIRTNNNLSQKIFKLNLTEILENKPDQNLELTPGDKITFFTNEEIYGKKFIYLEGHVKKPGKYNYYDGLTVYDILEKQGGLNDLDFQKETYLKQANIMRINTKTQTLEFIPFEIGLLLSGDKSKNFKLIPGDIVRVYARKTMVMDKFVKIEGRVKNPGIYKVDDNANLDSLIIEAGGFEPDALTNKIEASYKSDDGVMQKAVEVLDFSTFAAKTHALKNNELVIVPLDPYYALRNATVLVEGEIKVPGTYSYVPGEKLLDIIRRAGGTTDDAFIEGASFYRDGQKAELNIDEAVRNPDGNYNIIIRAGDKLEVPKLNYLIPVSGAVKSPQKIVFKKGETADYYIDKCNGFIETADKYDTELKYPNGDIKDAFRRYWFDREVPIGSSIEVPVEK